MSVIKIPNGTATIRDKLVSERHYRILEVVYMSAQPVIAKLQYALSLFAMNKLGFEEGATLTKKQVNSLNATTLALTDDERTEALSKVSFTPAESMTMYEIQDATIVAFLEHWSRKDPLPTLDTIQNIDRDTYKVLSEATRDRGTNALMAVTDFSPKPNETDPASGLDFPTGDSSDSNSPS